MLRLPIAMHIPDGFLDPGGRRRPRRRRDRRRRLRPAAGRPRRSTRRGCRCSACSPRSSSPRRCSTSPSPAARAGTSSGAALAAVLLGPWLACLVMAVVLIVQAFVFADGGISALGANILNMGVIGALLAGFVIAVGAARAAADARRVPRARRGRRVAGGDGRARPRPRSSSPSRAPCRWGPCCRRCSASTRCIGVGEAVDHRRRGQRRARHAAGPRRASAPPELAPAPPAAAAGRAVMTRGSRSRLFIAARAGARRRARDRRLAVRVVVARRPRAGRRATRGSSTRARCTRSRSDAPIPGYAFPGVDDARLATGLAGFAGTLGVFALGYGAGLRVRRRA